MWMNLGAPYFPLIRGFSFVVFDIGLFSGRVAQNLRLNWAIYSIGATRKHATSELYLVQVPSRKPWISFPTHKFCSRPSWTLFWLWHELQPKTSQIDVYYGKFLDSLLMHRDVFNWNVIHFLMFYFSFACNRLALICKSVSISIHLEIFSEITKDL